MIAGADVFCLVCFCEPNENEHPVVTSGISWRYHSEAAPGVLEVPKRTGIEVCRQKFPKQESEDVFPHVLGAEEEKDGVEGMIYEVRKKSVDTDKNIFTGSPRSPLPSGRSFSFVGVPQKKRGGFFLDSPLPSALLFFGLPV